jgi:acyl-CoA thioesterase
MGGDTPQSITPGGLSAFAQLLGFTIEQAEPGFARLRVAYRPDFDNLSQVAHGGVVASLMDTACGVALTTDPDGVRRSRVLTVSFTLNYLAAFAAGEMVCEARLIGGGRKLLTVETRAFSADGETVFASGQGVFRRIG